jgi:phage FluMu protein Com
VRWKTIEELRCKNCNKVLGKADFEGVIKKKCPRCSSMNIYFQRLGGKVYSFLEHKEK